MNMSNLPVYQGKRELIKQSHDVYNIVNEVCAAHKHFAGDYDLICEQFDAKTLKQVFQKIFDFCKSKMNYKAESANYQTTRSPAAILGTSKNIGVDCKHYAGFIAGILDGLRRAGKKIRWCYRFVSYDKADSSPSHVFVVAKDENGNEIFIDPVLSYLNCRFPAYFHSLDKNCNMLERISGIGLTFNKDALYNSNNLQAPIDMPISDKNPKTLFEPFTKKQTNWVLFVAGGLLLIFLISKNKKRGK